MDYYSWAPSPRSEVTACHQYYIIIIFRHTADVRLEFLHWLWKRHLHFFTLIRWEEDHRSLSCRCISAPLSWSSSPSPGLRASAFISASMGNRFSSKARTGSQHTRFRTKSPRTREFMWNSCLRLQLREENVSYDDGRQVSSSVSGLELHQELEDWCCPEYFVCLAASGIYCSQQWMPTWTLWGSGEEACTSRTCSTASATRWESW